MKNALKEQFFFIRVYDFDEFVSGNARSVFMTDNVIAVSYYRGRNDNGMFSIIVPDGHAILDYATLDTSLVFELAVGYRRRLDSASAARDAGQFYLFAIRGVFEDRQVGTDVDGNIYHVLTFPTLTQLLNRYVVAWESGVTDRTQFTGTAIDAIATMVTQYNATAVATVANGRLRDATVINNMTGGALAIDFGSTPETDYTVAPGRNLMDFLNEVSDTGHITYNVVFLSTLIFQVQRVTAGGVEGYNRSATMYFDQRLDTMRQANIATNRLGEKTVALVGGIGQQDERAVEVRTGANYAASNDYEVWINASDTPDDGLAGRGDIELYRLRAKANASCAPSSLPGYMYGRDFRWADLVTITVGDETQEKMIGTVQGSFNQSQIFQLSFELVDPPLNIVFQTLPTNVEI